MKAVAFRQKGGVLSDGLVLVDFYMEEN